MNLKEGDRIREYRLESLLSEGGMGSVWRACHIHLERQVAVKILSEKFAGDQGFEARFMQEARAMSRLQHPNILGVIDFFTETENLFLVLPFIDGGSLKDRLAQHVDGLHPDDAAALASPILGALGYAHRQGVVHRDVKPANILLDRNGHPYLTDFGIALIMGEERRTMSGGALGTPHYMSPEQIRDPMKIDLRTDVYSFGCVLYEMLAGHPPFSVESFTGALVAHCSTPAPLLTSLKPGFPKRLAEIVARSLEKDPDLRYQDCRQFQDAIETWKLVPSGAQAAAEESDTEEIAPDQVEPPTAVPPPAPVPAEPAQTVLSFHHAPAKPPAVSAKVPTPGGPARCPSPDAPEGPAHRPAAGAHHFSFPAQPVEALPPSSVESMPRDFDRMGREESLQCCVQMITRSKDLPAFAQSVAELLSLSANQDSYLDQLTNQILKNVSLTTKLLRVVNSVYFNRTGRKILSISHAVVMLGWNAVRNLAAGVMLFDKFNRNYPGVKELMLLTLLSANHARLLAHRSNYPDREEAYLCGMFSGMGELMAAYCFPRHYSKILKGVQEEKWTLRAGCLKILHFTFDDLGRALIGQWGLSERLAVGMELPEKVEARIDDEEDHLQVVTVLSRALAMAVYSMEPQDGKRQMKALVAKFGDSLGLRDDDVKEILAVAVDETKDTLSAASIPLDSLRMSQHIQNTMNRFQMEVTAAEEDGGESYALLTEEARENAAATARSRQEEQLFSLAAEVESVLDSGEAYELNDLLAMVMEAIFRGGKFDRVLFCLKEADHSHIRGRMGLGAGAQEMAEELRIPISLLSGPVGPVMISRRDVFVEDMEESRFGRSPFAAKVCCRAFGMCPVIVNDVPIGCFYFDRLKETLNLSAEAQEAIVSLRKRLGVALERSRVRVL